MCLLKYSTILTGKCQTLLVETSTLNFAISSALLEPSLSIMLGHRAEPLCSRSPASLDKMIRIFVAGYSTTKVKKFYQFKYYFPAVSYVQR